MVIKSYFAFLCTRYASLVLRKALLYPLPKCIMYKYNQRISNTVKCKTGHESLIKDVLIEQV